MTIFMQGYFFNKPDAASRGIVQHHAMILFLVNEASIERLSPLEENLLNDRISIWVGS